MKKLITLIVLLTAITTTTFSQVGINTDGSSPDASAILDVKSADKGLLIPRMTTAQRTSIISPVEGLMVYDTELGSLCFYRSGVWNQSLYSTSGWSLKGNAGANPATDFLGTTDNNALVLKYNNLASGRIDSTLTFFGYTSGKVNAGSFSTLVGSGAGMKVTSGNSNTALGYRALYSSTTGSKNTALGSQSDVSANYLTNSTAIGYSAVATNSNQVRLGNDDITSFICKGAYAATSNATPNMTVNASGQIMRSTATVVSGTGVASQVAFWNAPGVLTGNVKLYWDNANSRLGIGTGTPGQKLDVKDGNLLLSNNGSAGEIRFAEPFADGSNYTAFRAQNQARDVTYILPASDGDSSNILSTDGAGTLYWEVSATGDIKRVGSMTYGDAFAGPEADDNWLGLGAASGRIEFADQDTDEVNILDAKVGIGTSTPRQQLEITGNFMLPYTTDSSGVIYRDSVPWLHNYKKSGTYGHNIFIGDNAGNFTLSGATCNDGSWLVGIGDSALINNTTGKINLGIGYDALRDNTTGERNVAVGALSMSSNKHGYGNTAVGYQALRYGDSTVTNVAIGQSALMNLKGLGSCNDAVGAGALENLVWGDDNIGFGSGVMITMDSGYANIAIGTYSMFQKQRGARNTVVGHNGMYHNVNGDRNTTFGAWSGYENVTGTGNIFLGEGAGYWEKGSDKLYISNDTASAPLIWGDLLNDTIRINGNLSGTENFNLTGNIVCKELQAEASIKGVDFIGTGNIYMPSTHSDSLGVILKDGLRFIHNYKPDSNMGYNTFLGMDAGNFTMGGSVPSEASNNTGIGKQSLKGLTTGYCNTGIGSASLIQNTTGFKNTAIGQGALYNNLTGYNNTGLGFQALYNNTTYNNTAVGVNSLVLTASGSNNTAVGTHAGFSNVTGYNNVYLGYYTGYNTIGSGNVFIGSQAGFNEPGSDKLYIDNSPTSFPLIYGDLANDSIRINGNLCVTKNFELLSTSSSAIGVIYKGDTRFIHDYKPEFNTGMNTFIGSDAGNFTMSGPNADDASYNTGLGSQVMNVNTSGAFNTAVGSGALQSNSTGSGNVMLGYQAGNLIMTGAYNTAIGYSAGCAENDSNTIAIGYLASAEASNQVRLGNAAITSLYCQGAYFGTVGTDNVDLLADNTGKIGYKPSSARYKDNISDMEDVGWLYGLRPVNFSYKSDEMKSRQYGLIAEEVEKINPDFVHYNSDGQVETVSYSQLIAPMIKAIQDQNNTINDLKGDIDFMKAEREQLLRNQELLMSRLEALEKEQEGLSQK